MKPILSCLFFFVLVIQGNCFADSISREVLFSEVRFVGGILCSELNAGGYCESPIPVLDEKGTALPAKEKVISACVQGGGDCTVVAVVYETKAMPSNTVLARLETLDKKQPAWVKVNQSNFKTTQALLPELGFGSNHVEFRPELKHVFLDKEMTKKIPISEVQSYPQKSELNSELESIEFQEATTPALKEKKVVALRVNYLKYKADKIDSDPSAARQEGARTKIRDIYFPAFDSKGRINYWYLPDPGC